MPRLLLPLLLLCLPLTALAAEDDEELIEEEEEIDPEVDDRAIYDEYVADLQGESPTEEIDAWYRYLEAYPKSLFKLEIERRIEALEDASYNEMLDEQAAAAERGKRIDAKSAEMDIAEPALLSINPNPRRRAEVGVLWGYQNLLQYDLNFEYAFLRKFSVWGGVRHDGGGGAVGLGVQVGAKYALIKDTSSGVILSGWLAFQMGYTRLDETNLALQPGIGFAWAPIDLVQFSTSLQIDLGSSLQSDADLNRFRTQVWWDAMVVINPNKILGIYAETNQKHRLHKPEFLSLQYMAMFQAGVGVKIRPNSIMEFTVGVNVPYFWRVLKDYQYVGVHAPAVFKLPKGPSK